MICEQELRRLFNRKYMMYACIMLICVCGVYAGLADVDFYWQAALGKASLDGNFNKIYDLIWGSAGVSEYLDHEWLCNIIFYIFSLFPYRYMAVLKLVICILTGIQFVRYIRSEKKDYTDIQMYLIYLFIFLYMMIYCKVKAYSFSLLFFMEELMLLRRIGVSHKRVDYIKMVILSWVWFNFHSGSALLFFGVYGMWWLCTGRKMRQMLWGIICLLVTFINPYGIRLWFFNIRHFFDPTMKMIIKDWKGLDFTIGNGYVVFGVCLFCVIVAVLHMREFFFKSMLVFVFTYLSFSSMRHCIYMFPLAISLVGFISIGEKKLTHGVDVIASGFLAFLIVFDVLVGSGYGDSYVEGYIDSELISEIKKVDNEGLFTDCSYMCLWQYDIKEFSVGAYPVNATRVQDVKTMTCYGGESSIESIINHYGLNSFVFCKWNSEVEYYDVTSPLFDYLSARSDEYELVYDSDMLVFFVRR